MKIKLLLYCCILVICFGCKSYKTKYPYSLDDFRPELRVDLQKIVQAGVAGAYYSKKFEENCTVSDLHKMFKCEHPLIRAKAFYLLTKKDSNNVKEILLSSLDDTAIISVDQGEWGIPRMYCADYYLNEFQSAKFRNEKNGIKTKKIVDILITKYPNLHNTYNELLYADTIPEIYYNKVLSMTNSIINAEDIGNGTPILYYEVNEIIFALSKYKKQKDISLITKNLRLNNKYKWKIIQDNPAPEYFELLRDFFEKMKQANKNGPEYFQALIQKQEIPKQFYHFLYTLSKYKNKESADIFLQIYKQKIYPTLGNVRPNQFECYLHDLLVKASCLDYESLIKALKPFAEKYKKQYNLSPNESTFNYEDINYIHTFDREYF